MNPRYRFLAFALVAAACTEGAALNEARTNTNLEAPAAELTEALMTAGTVRFRPVMLTAITTILGLTPMAVGISFDFRSLTLQVGGEMAVWWGPMAVAVIFGLAVATLLTLVVVPVLYSISETASLKGAVRVVSSKFRKQPVTES